MPNLSGQLRLEQLEDSVALKVGRKYLGRIYGVKSIGYDRAAHHVALIDKRGFPIASLDNVAGVKYNAP